MNYLSHAAAFLDEPLVAAGSVLPDFLSAMDRKCRVRAKRVDAYLATEPPGEPGRVAAGLREHLADDHWFHGTEAFLTTQARLTRRLRAAMPDDASHRVGFLGHILVELLLDGWIERTRPGTVGRFYDAMAAAAPTAMTEAVNASAARPTTRIIEVWPGFLRERFVADYVADDRLRRRVNQVLGRVGLPVLDEAAEATLAQCRAEVEASAGRLLPQRVLNALA